MRKPIGRVLVACECSGRVRDAFAELGWDAWSCDLQPSETPGQHFQGDVKEMLTQQWDLLIAHPPCTYLAASGQQWLRTQCDVRYPAFLEAVVFFKMLLDANVPYICVENPIMHKWGKEFIRKHDCVIQPYEHGHEAQKTTWLWLKGLPPLRPTNVVGKGEFYVSPSGTRMSMFLATSRDLSDDDRRRVRSRTFQGIADAMALQWTTYILARRAHVSSSSSSTE